MQDPNCIFCKIVQGSIPCLKIWEDSHALAFLDVGPLADGHVLLIPKDHYPDIRDISSDALGKLLAPLPRLTQAVMRVTKASGMNVLQNTGRSSGQAVFHLHFHLIPRVEHDGLGYRWNAGSYQGARGEELRAQLSHELQS